MDSLLRSWLRVVKSNVEESLSEIQEAQEESVYPFLAYSIADSPAIQDAQWKSFPTEEVALGKIDNSYWHFY